MKARGIVSTVAVFALSGAACRRQPEISTPEWQYEIARTPQRWRSIPEIALLRDYVRIDTSNPPGNERAGAEFLRESLACEGISSELLCPSADRCNLYARIRGRERGNGVLLLNHIDVVPVYAPYWKKPPFEGVIEQGYLYGRGSYDMKSIGIAQLLAFEDLVRSGIKPRRDVIFLAECDEERSGHAGVAWIYAHHPELLSGVGLVLNEGGYQEAIAGEIRFWGIEIGQGGSGFALLAADDPGAITYSKSFEDFSLDERPSSLVRLYLNAVSDFRAPDFANAYRHPELLRDPNLRKLIPFQNLSLIEGGVQRLPPFSAKLVPGFDFGKAWDAPITVSLPLGVDPGPYLDREIAGAMSRGAIVGYRKVTPPGSASPYPTPETDALSRVVEALHPGVPIIPIVNSFAETTSVEFRSRSVATYGFTPFQIDPADAARRHGNDERIYLPFFTRGVTAMREVLFELVQ